MVGSQMSKLIKEGDIINGKTVTFTSFTRSGFDGNQLGLAADAKDWRITSSLHLGRGPEPLPLCTRQLEGPEGNLRNLLF